MAGENSRLSQFKQKLGIGARVNKYRVILTIPTGVGSPLDGTTIDSLAKSSQIPSKTMGQVEAFTQGRKIILAGDAEFSNSWNITFYDTEEHKVRDAFIKWQEMMDDFANHSRGITNHNDYMANPIIQQLSTIDNSVKAIYEFFNMFPTEVSETEMSDESNNTLLEFSVTFAFSHFIRKDTYKPFGEDKNPLA